MVFAIGFLSRTSRSRSTCWPTQPGPSEPTSARCCPQGIVSVSLHGKGAHGSMPHNSVDPVVLAALVVLRLQTIVSRETKPGEFAVLTVGSSVAGAKSNIIPDHAVLLANLRTYDVSVRKRMIESIERMVKAECEASGSPK